MDALTQTPLTGLSYERNRQTPINWIEDLPEATHQLPGYDEETVRKLLYLDRGKAGSNMTTRGLAHAVYTKKGAIHCDAALFGELIVGYTISKECSTVLLTSRQDSTRVEIQFIK